VLRAVIADVLGIANITDIADIATDIADIAVEIGKRVQGVTEVSKHCITLFLLLLGLVAIVGQVAEGYTAAAGQAAENYTVAG